MNEGQLEISKSFSRIDNQKEVNIQKDDKKTENKFDIEKYIADNKAVIYSILFFSCGLAIGAIIYKTHQSDALNGLIISECDDIAEQFGRNLCNCLSYFLTAVFLAFCIIGYPLVNLIPLLMGMQACMQSAYYFINYEAKGIAYSLLMIAPFTALFFTVLVFTIQASSDMSKQILSLSKKAEISTLSIKPAMKKFFIYGLIIIISSGASAVLEVLLKSIVTVS